MWIQIMKDLCYVEEFKPIIGYECMGLDYLPIVKDSTIVLFIFLSWMTLKKVIVCMLTREAYHPEVRISDSYFHRIVDQ